MQQRRQTHIPRRGSQGRTSHLHIAFSHISKTFFQAGELYLFHRSDMRCPSNNSLWGQYDKHEQGRLYLESSCLDLRTFRKWHILPSVYRYCRKANRSELRDYVCALFWSEMHNMQPPTFHKVLCKRKQ